MRKLTENAAKVLAFLQKDGNTSDLTRADIADALDMDVKKVGGYLLSLTAKSKKNEDGEKELVEESLITSVDGTRPKTTVNADGEEVTKDAKVKFVKLTQYGMDFDIASNMKA